MRSADLLPLLADLLPTRGRVACGSPEVAAALDARDDVEVVVLEGLSPDGHGGELAALTDRRGQQLDGVLLLDGEVARAGIRGAGMVAAAVEACRPGGLVALATPSATWQALRRGPDGNRTRGWAPTAGDAHQPTASGPAAVGHTAHGMTAAHVVHALEERGCGVTLVAGVGAAAALAGREWAGADDLAHDRTPGLHDAGPVVLAAGITPQSAAQRSHVFFGSITTRILAASVICTDAQGRMLVIDDLFKGAWSLPGGLVDAGEAPDAAAVREALEEGGVEVELGRLLGVFSHEHPHRVHLIYAATPVRPTPSPQPIHLHEIGASRWLEVDEALRLIAPDIARKVRACLDEPGGTWHW